MGDPYADHSCWQNPETMDTPRTLYKIDQYNPGTEIAAETAAALAAASFVFRTSDVQYSELLRQTAIRVRGCLLFKSECINCFMLIWFLATFFSVTFLLIICTTVV